MSGLADAVKDELDGEPTAGRAIKLLDYATERGWTENVACSFVIRLTREDALPFYARWDLAYDEVKAKRSWRFAGAMAQNGQKLNYNDIKTYLDDPAVIFPEPPDEECEAAQFDNENQTTRTALGALVSISKPDPSYINGPPKRAVEAAGWGALLP